MFFPLESKEIVFFYTELLLLSGRERGKKCRISAMKISENKGILLMVMGLLKKKKSFH